MRKEERERLMEKGRGVGERRGGVRADRFIMAASENANEILSVDFVATVIDLHVRQVTHVTTKNLPNKRGRGKIR